MVVGQEIQKKVLTKKWRDPSTQTPLAETVWKYPWSVQTVTRDPPTSPTLCLNLADLPGEESAIKARVGGQGKANKNLFLICPFWVGTTPAAAVI